MEVADLLGIDRRRSWRYPKTGEGVEELLVEIIRRAATGGRDRAKARAGVRLHLRPLPRRGGLRARAEGMVRKA